MFDMSAEEMIAHVRVVILHSGNNLYRCVSLVHAYCLSLWRKKTAAHYYAYKALILSVEGKCNTRPFLIAEKKNKRKKISLQLNVMKIGINSDSEYTACMQT